MNGKLWKCAASLGLASIVFAGTPSYANPLNEMAPSAAQESKHAVSIKKHIERTKEWADSEYRIEFNRRENDTSVYWVIHEDDRAAASAGGGKSIEIHVDSDTLEVLRELAFQ